jgi:hypothetical protein
MLRARSLTVALTTLLVAASLPVNAQTRRNTGRSDGCNNSGWDDSRRASFCEVREETIGGSAPLDVDAAPTAASRLSAGTAATCWSAALFAGPATPTPTARRVVAGVQIETAAHIRATGPERDDRANWSVQFELHVPHRAQLALKTNNGGISIDDFQGIAEFQARNGGVTLRNVGGEIKGETTNGGLTIDLTGDHWDGQGLDVSTRNGGIKMTVPDRYSAELETGTVNGRVSTNFPVMVQGRFDRQLNTTLGSGGVKLRAMTTNGGVTIRRQ